MELNKNLALTLNAQRTALAEAITERHYEAQPDLVVKYGEMGREKCRQDAEYHLSYLANAVAASSPALFADYIGWAKVMLASRRIPAADLSRNLEFMSEAIHARLPAEFAPLVREYIEFGLQSLANSTSATESSHNASENAEPHQELAGEFLRLLLAGDRYGAEKVVLNALDSGITPQEIYIHVFQASQRRIGWLWQTNQVSVAQEHFCTAATQLVMAQLYPRIFRGEKNGRRIVATSIAGELHEIGVRIVTDFFEMEGWDTYYLGANCPTPGILQALAERKPDVLAVSATMTFHLNAVAQLIAAVRAVDELRDIKILVGGYPFNIEPELWKRIGADACATDARDAVAIAEQLLAT